MTPTFVSALDFGLEATAQVLTRGFSDYFVPITSSPAILLGMVRADSVDLAASRVLVRDGQPIAAALIARRGWTSRLAGMAVVPEARHGGVGRVMVEHLLNEARARGERTMVLEVIEQNDPAVKLYERCGFTRIRRLTGHSRRAAAEAQGSNAALEQIDPRALAQLIAVHGLPDLPWQVSAETVAQTTPPAVALRLGASAVLLSDPTASVVGIRALVTEREARGQGGSRTLLRAVMARFPGREWRASAIFPEEMSEAFTSVGLVRTSLSQWQMTRTLV